MVVDLASRGRALEAEVRGITQKIKSACQQTDEGVDHRRALSKRSRILQANKNSELGITPMKIGILGVGHVGKTLTQRLAQAGHSVKVANSRAPHTIEEDVLALGARAVTTGEALADIEVVILSIPLGRIPGFAPLVTKLPEDTAVIDTSNYYLFRDDKIQAIEAGRVESV